MDRSRRLILRAALALAALASLPKALLAAASAEEQVCESPEPRVRFRSFGESGLDIELLCWIPEPELRGRVLDALNTDVYRRFAEAGIEIPYPKRDLYVKEMPGSAQ